MVMLTSCTSHLDDAAGARRAPYDGDCLPDPVRIKHSVRHQEGFASRTRLALSSEKKQSKTRNFVRPTVIQSNDHF